MRKLLSLIAVAGFAGGGFMLAPADAAEDAGCLSDSGAGNEAVVDACGGFDENGGHGKIDGNDENPAPAGGYISGGNDGYYEHGDATVCISDQGDPEEELDAEGNDADPGDDGACDEDIPEAVLAYLTP